MPAAPWPVRLELGLRLPRAPKQDLRARGRSGAHRGVDGGGRGVWEGSEAGRRWRPQIGERKGMRVRMYPSKIRPKRELGSTNGHGEVRRCFGWLWRRRSRTGGEDSSAAVAHGSEQGMEKGRGEARPL